MPCPNSTSVKWIQGHLKSPSYILSACQTNLGVSTTRAAASVLNWGPPLVSATARPHRAPWVPISNTNVRGKYTICENPISRTAQRGGWLIAKMALNWQPASKCSLLFYPKRGQIWVHGFVVEATDTGVWRVISRLANTHWIEREGRTTPDSVSLGRPFVPSSSS